MKNKEQQEHFLKTGHLINKKIQCNKCETDVTMFGSNLENRIKKFGTLWSLLDEFKCRKCISASKPAKPIKEKKVRKVKLHKKTNEQGEVIYSIPTLKPYVSREVFLKDSPEQVTKCTENGTCIRPDIYLNNNRACRDCPYAVNCKASVKRLIFT